MSVRSVLLEVGGVLNSLGCITVLRANEGPDSEPHIGYLCEVSNLKNWSGILEAFLLSAKGFTSHICERYYIQDGKLTKSWYLRFRADDLEKAGKKIMEGLLKARVRTQKSTPRDIPATVGAPAGRSKKEARPVTPIQPTAPKSPSPFVEDTSQREVEIKLPWRVNPEQKNLDSRGARRAK
jgi:hypothetical protein